MNFWQNIKRDRYLLYALAIALILRTINPTFGSPSLYISNDEAIAHLSALNMIAEQTPISIANYTPLGAYVQIPFLIFSFLAMKTLGYVNAVSDFELFVLTHEGYFLFIPRLISGLFGTLTILVIYKISKELFHERKTAIVAAFLTAVSFNLVHISHFGRPWAAVLFFMVLSVYLALKKKILASFLLTAISYGFHQVGIFILPLLLIINLRIRLRQIHGIILFALLFFILNKLTLESGIIDAISHGQSFLKPDTVVSEILSGRLSWQSVIDTYANNLVGYFSANFLVTDFAILILGLLGILKLMREGNHSIKLYIIFIVGYFIFASLFFYPLLRYLLPIIILFIPLAAYILSKTQLLIVVAVVFVASVNSLWWNWLYIKTPTFIQANDWINDHIPVDKPIAYTGGRFQTFAPNTEAIQHMQSASPNVYQRLLSTERNYSDNVRNIIYLGKFPDESKFEQLENATVNYPVEYVIDYYLDEKERLFNFNPEFFEIVTRMSPADSDYLVGLPEPLFDPSWNFPANDPRPKVSMYTLSRIGPYFDILRVKKLLRFNE